MESEWSTILISVLVSAAASAAGEGLKRTIEKSLDGVHPWDDIQGHLDDSLYSVPVGGPLIEAAKEGGDWASAGITSAAQLAALAAGGFGGYATAAKEALSSMPALAYGASIPDVSGAIPATALGAATAAAEEVPYLGEAVSDASAALEPYLTDIPEKITEGFGWAEKPVIPGGTHAVSLAEKGGNAATMPSVMETLPTGPRPTGIGTLVGSKAAGVGRDLLSGGAQRTIGELFKPKRDRDYLGALAAGAASAGFDQVAGAVESAVQGQVETSLDPALAQGVAPTEVSVEMPPPPMSVYAAPSWKRPALDSAQQAFYKGVLGPGRGAVSSLAYTGAGGLSREDLIRRNREELLRSLTQPRGVGGLMGGYLPRRRGI